MSKLIRKTGEVVEAYVFYTGEGRAKATYGTGWAAEVAPCHVVDTDTYKEDLPCGK